MPELPEVYTISSQLEKEIKGRVIENVLIRPGYKVFPSNNDFIEGLVGSKIEGVERLAKLILIKLSKNKSERFAAFHLAMTGRILLESDPFLVRFKVSGGLAVSFTDRRKFGYVKLLDGPQLLLLKKRYGPDPFCVTLDEFEARLKSRAISIKSALLDQSLVSGVGNIYANESLWAAKINPMAKTSNLSKDDFRNLLSSLRKILREAIENRGSTLGDLMYVDIYGNYGNYQNHHRIYGREGEPCPRCGSPIFFTKLNSRGTFYCLVCQPPIREQPKLNIN